MKNTMYTGLAVIGLMLLYGLDAIGVSAFLPYVAVASVIGTVLILGYAHYYMKNKGKPLFWTLALGVMLAASPAQALIQEDVQKIETYNSVCNAKKLKEGDDPKAFKPDATVVDRAKKVLDLAMLIPENRLTTKAAETVQCARVYLGNVSVVESEQSKSTSCKTIKQRIEEGSQDCWVCGVGGIIIESIERLVYYTEPWVKKLALQLLAVLFLFWIAFQALMLFINTGAGGGKFIATFMTRFIVVIIVAAFVMAPTREIFKLAVSPFIGMASGIGIQMTQASFAANEHGTLGERIEQKFGLTNTACPQYCDNLGDVNNPDLDLEEYKIDQNNRVYTPIFSNYARNGFLCLTCRVSNQAMPLISLGSSLWCYATHDGMKRFWWYKLWLVPLPDGIALLWGGLMVVTFMLFMFFVTFYLLDSFFRIGLLALFTPLFIALAAFPSTRKKYVMGAFKVLVFSILQLFGMALAIVLLMHIFTAFIPGIDDLLSVIASPTEPVLKLKNAVWDNGMIYFMAVIIGTFIFGIQIVKSVTDIVTDLSGIGDPGSVGGHMATQMANEMSGGDGSKIAGAGAIVAAGKGGKSPVSMKNQKPKLVDKPEDAGYKP